MRTKIDWPDTMQEMSGMDRFCGGPSHEDYDANTYKRWVKPIVEEAIINLENEIDRLEQKVAKLKSEKPKLRYDKTLDIWYVVPKEKK